MVNDQIRLWLYLFGVELAWTYWYCVPLDAYRKIRRQRHITYDVIQEHKRPKKKRDLIFKHKCFQSYFWFLFFVLSICNLKKLSLCFFWDCLGRHYFMVICLAESWKHFLKSKTAFVCFLIQGDTGKQHSDSTLSVLPLQYKTFLASIASSCLLTPSACAHSRLFLVLISSPELRFWLKSYRPRNTFFFSWIYLGGFILEFIGLIGKIEKWE